MYNVYPWAHWATLGCPPAGLRAGPLGACSDMLEAPTAGPFWAGEVCCPQNAYTLTETHSPTLSCTHFHPRPLIQWTHTHKCTTLSQLFMDTNTLMCLFFFFCLFRAAPTAYGGSQAGGWIGATAAGLHHSHSNTRSKPLCNLYHSSWQCRILNPLGSARDWTLILIDTSQIHSCWAMTGTPKMIMIFESNIYKDKLYYLALFWTSRRRYRKSKRKILSGEKTKKNIPQRGYNE